MKPLCFAVVLGVCAPAWAQVADGGADVPAVEAGDAGAPSGSSLADELDQAAGAPAPSRPAVVAAPVAPAPTASRGFQSMNPDISVIIDATGGFAKHAPYSLAGDDPDLK